MKPVIIVRALALLASAVASTTSAQLAEINRRCEEDDLTPQQAIDRVAWYLAVYPDRAKADAEASLAQSIPDADVPTYWTRLTQIDPFGRPSARPLYPTFGDASYANPLGYHAPPLSEYMTPIPAGYRNIGLCQSSCYKPDGLVRFAEQIEGQVQYRDVPIYAAFNERTPELAVLSEDSTLEAPELRAFPVQSYTESAEPTTHQIYVFKTEAGHALEVTGNHPIVDATGAMREAETFELGEALVRADGTLEAITSIEIQPYYGRVYNVAPRTYELLNNVVVANGFLNGSSHYQNALVDRLNIKLFRANIPDEILE